MNIKLFLFSSRSKLFMPGKSEIPTRWKTFFFRRTGRESISVVSFKVDFWRDKNPLQKIDLNPSSCWESSPCNKQPWYRLPGYPRYRTPLPRNWPRHVEWCVYYCHCIYRWLAGARHCHRSRNPRRANRRRTFACTRSASTACTLPCIAH